MSYYVTCPHCNTKIEVLGYFNNESDDYVIFCNSCCKEFEATYVDGEIKVKKEENMKELKYKEKDRVLICACAQILDVEPKNSRDTKYFVEIDTCDFINNEGWIGEDDILCELGEIPKAYYEDGYEQGLKDAWEMARLICMETNDGGLPTDQLEDIYDGCDIDPYIMKKYSAQEAINKYNEWRESKKIKMGDIVEYDVAGGCERAIFYSEGPQVWWLLKEGLTEPLYVCKEDFKLRKVGESGLDIADAFAKIREMEG